MQQSAPNHLHHLVDRLTSRSDLSAAEQRAVLDLPAEIVHAPPNFDLVGPGDTVAHACFVAEGLVGRFDQNACGQRQITALHIPGEIPDLHAVVLPGASVALQALAPTTVLQIPLGALRALATGHSAVAEAFWRSCMVDALIMAQWIVNIGRRSARCRLAHLLCEMAMRYNGPQLSGRVIYNLPMTQTHLADVTGLTSVHVSRSLQSLGADGVEVRRGTVYIADWHRLVQVAEFEADYLQLGRPDWTGRHAAAVDGDRQCRS